MEKTKQYEDEVRGDIEYEEWMKEAWESTAANLFQTDEVDELLGEQFHGLISHERMAHWDELIHKYYDLIKDPVTFLEALYKISEEGEPHLANWISNEMRDDYLALCEQLTDTMRRHIPHFMALN